MSPIHILVVCTGNLCRSPIAEHALRQRLPRDGSVIVRSAGTRMASGREAPEQTLRAAARLGLDLRGHRTTSLTAADLASADLVLAAAREHRRVAVSMEPRVLRRTFTLRELGRVVASGASRPLAADTAADPADRVASWVATMSALRGSTTRPLRPEDDDVVDPWGQADDVFDQTLAQLTPSVELVADSLGSLLSTTAGEGRS
jgi:protein-tyrosine phosphatase